MLFMFWGILLLQVVAAEVTLQIPPQGSVNSSIIVHWERGINDPRFWDLRFSDQAKGLNLDMGIVAATIDVEASVKSGEVSVMFPKAGQFILRAVRAPSVNVASSEEIAIDNLQALTPTNTSEGSATPSPSSTASPSAGTNSDNPSTAPIIMSAGSSKPFSRTPIIVGAVVGGVALLSLIGLFTVWFIHRHRRHQREATQRLTFHHDNTLTLSPLSQQEHQPPPYARNSRTLHSLESPTPSFPPSTYLASTLPEYYARSLSPPPYSHFSGSRSQSLRTTSTRSGNGRFWSLGSNASPPSLTVQTEHNEKQ